MKRDFVVIYNLVQSYDHIQRRAIDYLLGAATSPPPELGHLARLTDPVAKVELLAQALISPSKSYAQSGDRRSDTGGLKQATAGLNTYFQEQRRKFLVPLGLTPDLPSLQALPDLSFALHLRFTLRKPYISQDEAEFYIIDNPVRKDKVFKVPYVAPSQWKGTLRATMVRQLVERGDSLSDEQFADRRLALALLFGDEKGEEPGNLKALAKYLDDIKPRAASIYRRKIRERFKVEEKDPMPHHAGRLHFYPTFFSQIGLEIINPHSRESGAGEVPILIESVPAGDRGDLVLLYVPRGGDEALARQEAAADLKRVAEGLRAMLTVYGFGAKTSSGYGVVKERLVGQGVLKVRVEGLDEAAAQPTLLSAPPRPDVVREFLTQYPDEDFSLKVQAWRKKHKVGKGPAARYRAAKAAFARYQQELERFEAEQAASSPQIETLSSAMVRRTFETLTELETVASALARELAEEMGGKV